MWLLAMTAVASDWHSDCSTLARGVPRFHWRLKMLGLIAAILIAIWLLGMVSSYTLGGFIHVLLIVAVVALLIRVIEGRSIV